MGSFGDLIGEMNIKPIVFLQPDCPESFMMTMTQEQIKTKSKKDGGSVL
jgi:hypothetical protein